MHILFQITIFSVRSVMALRNGKVKTTGTEFTVGKAPACHPIGSRGNNLIGELIPNIPTTRTIRQLPSGRTVLRYFQYQHKIGRKTKNEAAKITEAKLRELYNTAGIDMMSTKQAATLQALGGQ